MVFLFTLSNVFSQSSSTVCRLLYVYCPCSATLLTKCVAYAVFLSFLNPNCAFCKCVSTVLASLFLLHIFCILNLVMKLSVVFIFPCVSFFVY